MDYGNNAALWSHFVYFQALFKSFNFRLQMLTSCKTYFADFAYIHLQDVELKKKARLLANNCVYEIKYIIALKYIFQRVKNFNGKNWFIIGTHIWNILHTFYDDICFVSCFRSFHLICYCKEEYYSIFWKCAIFTTYEILVKFQLIIWEKGSYSMKQINTR